MHRQYCMSQDLPNHMQPVDLGESLQAHKNCHPNQQEIYSQAEPQWWNVVLYLLSTHPPPTAPQEK